METIGIIGFIVLQLALARVSLLTSGERFCHLFLSALASKRRLVPCGATVLLRITCGLWIFLSSRTGVCCTSYICEEGVPKANAVRRRSGYTVSNICCSVAATVFNPKPCRFVAATVLSPKPYLFWGCYCMGNDLNHPCVF